MNDANTFNLMNFCYFELKTLILELILSAIMIKTTVLIILLFLINLPATAQNDMGWDAKFAFGGGFTPGWIIPDINEINRMMDDFGTGSFAKSGFFATGGAGYISIAVVKNIRIGLMGLGGSMTKTGSGLESKYSLSVLGFTAEYTFPFIPYVAVSAGAVIGGGTTSLDLHKYSSSYNADWNDLWDEMYGSGNTVANFSRKISNSYFTVIPTLNVDIPLYRFFAFRIGGGYQIALNDSWELDNEHSLQNTPDGLSSNAVFIQAGIFIGYFNY